MDKFGRKLNAVWEAITDQTEAIKSSFDKLVDTLSPLPKKIDEQAERIDKLAANTDQLQKTVAAEAGIKTVNIQNLYTELKKYFDEMGAQPVEVINFPELTAVAGTVSISNIDELANLLASILPGMIPNFPTGIEVTNWPEATEVFGTVQVVPISTKADEALTVRLSDGDKFIDLVKELQNALTVTVNGGGGGIGWPDYEGLVPTQYDFIQAIPHADRPVTVIYKQGGPTGNTVATLNITYDGTSDRILTAERV